MATGATDVECAEVRITCADAGEAARIADALVDRRLAACVHQSAIRSVFEWEGTVEHDDEVLLAAMTRSSLLDPIVALVDDMHGYDLPAVTMVPMRGSAAYLAWVVEQTAR